MSQQNDSLKTAAGNLAANVEGGIGQATDRPGLEKNSTENLFNLI